MCGDDNMLKKSICRKCYNEKPWRDWLNMSTQDIWWGRGVVRCVGVCGRSHTTRWIRIDGEPPDSCPYILEQIL